MLVKELPEDIMLIALERGKTCSIVEGKTDKELLEVTVKSAFTFIATPEGSDIWWEVMEGNFANFYKFHEELISLEW